MYEYIYSVWENNPNGELFWTQTNPDVYEDFNESFFGLSLHFFMCVQIFKCA